jgi:thiol-disulfide isomerase/thioredoxin
MRTPRIVIPLVAAMVVAGAGQPPRKDPAEKPAPAASAQPAWPEKKTKKLYADDWRGKKAPEFVVEQMLTDQPDRKSKVVLIDFWATWCPPCREAIPELNQFQEKFKDDLVVIGVSDEKPNTVREFMKKTPIKYTLAIDQQKRMKDQLKVTGIPHVIIVSTDGIVRWQGFPLSDEEHLTEDIVRRVIEADPGVKARHAKAQDKDKKAAAPDKGKKAGGG